MAARALTWRDVVAIQINGVLTAVRSRFVGNGGDEGGAVSCANPATCIITDCVFEDTATSGGTLALVGTVFRGARS